MALYTVKLVRKYTTGKTCTVTFEYDSYSQAYDRYKKVITEDVHTYSLICDKFTLTLIEGKKDIVKRMSISFTNNLF